MTNPGEEVNTAPDHFGDASKMVDAMVEEAAKPIYAELYTTNLDGGVWPHEWDYCKQHARAALESLGVDLAVLAEMKSGRRLAMTQDDLEERIAESLAMYIEMTAPKTPEAAR